MHVTATTSFVNCGVYDNTATFTTTNDGTGTANAQEACQRSDVHLTKTADHESPVNPGEAIGFTVTLHNNGPGRATGAAINDPLPGGTFGTVTWSESPDNPDCSITGNPGSQVLACGPKTLLAGEEISVHLTATTSPVNCGVYDNTATFSTTNDGSGPASAREACVDANIQITPATANNPVGDEPHADRPCERQHRRRLRERAGRDDDHLLADQRGRRDGGVRRAEHLHDRGRHGIVHRGHQVVDDRHDDDQGGDRRHGRRRRAAPRDG